MSNSGASEGASAVAGGAPEPWPADDGFACWAAAAALDLRFPAEEASERPNVSSTTVRRSASILSGCPEEYSAWNITFKNGKSFASDQWVPDAKNAPGGS